MCPAGRGTATPEALENSIASPLVPLDGLEPSHLAPEASALSSELQGQVIITVLYANIALFHLHSLPGLQAAIIIPQYPLNGKGDSKKALCSISTLAALNDLLYNKGAINRFQEEEKVHLFMLAVTFQESFLFAMLMAHIVCACL